MHYSLTAPSLKASEIFAQIIKTIEITGYLSEPESAKGKTAVWFNGIHEVLNYDANDYAFTNGEIENELNKAQQFVNEKIIANGWLIEPIAKIVTHEF